MVILLVMIFNVMLIVLIWEVLKWCIEMQCVNEAIVCVSVLFNYCVLVMPSGHDGLLYSMCITLHY